MANVDRKQTVILDLKWKLLFLNGYVSVNFKEHFVFLSKTFFQMNIYIRNSIYLIKWLVDRRQ